jgi:hypothetical protein
MQKNTPHLSERNLQTIYTVGLCKYLSSHQLKDEFYPTTTHENATQRLTELARLGFLSRDAAYPKAVSNPGQRPSYIYFFSSKNKQKLQEYLTRSGKADRYEDFAVLSTIDKDDGDNFSNAHLVHETNIAAFFLPLIKACDKTPDWELLMWEITSPRSADIPDKDLTVHLRQRKKDGSVEPTTAYRHFNPDGLALLREPFNTYSLNVLETDNNTNKSQGYAGKVRGLHCLRQTG